MELNASLFGLMLIGALASVGCGSSRDVEVTGEVSAPATAQGPILLHFYDYQDEEWSRVLSVELDSAGKFSEKVSLEGDQLRVRAIADADGDGACSAGEAWQQVKTEITEDDTASVTLLLTQAACPDEQ